MGKQFLSHDLVAIIRKGTFQFFRPCVSIILHNLLLWRHDCCVFFIHL